MSMEQLILTLKSDFLANHSLSRYIIEAFFFFIVLVVREINKKYGNWFIFLCLIWWIFLSFVFFPKGQNFKIYRYNAEQTLYNFEAFGRPENKESGEYGKSYKHPSYLDYSGAQHLIYVTLASINLSNISPKLESAGFQLWNVLLFILSILFIAKLKKTNEEDNTNSILSICFLAFNPVFAQFWLISSWEDKIIFLAIPLVLLYLIQQKRLLLSSFFTGTVVTFNSLLVFFVPVLYAYLLKEKVQKKHFHIVLFFSGVALTLIPFFPESLYGWMNRSERMNIKTPFWYSVYSLLPAGIYSPILNYLIIICAVTATLFFFWKEKIDLNDAMILSILILIFLGPFNNVARTIPIIMLIIILTPHKNKLYWAITFIILSIYFSFGWIFSFSNIQYFDLILFHFPIVFIIVLYILKRNHKILKLPSFNRMVARQ